MPSCHLWQPGEVNCYNICRHSSQLTMSAFPYPSYLQIRQAQQRISKQTPQRKRLKVCLLRFWGYDTVYTATSPLPDMLESWWHTSLLVGSQSLRGQIASGIVQAQ